MPLITKGMCSDAESLAYIPDGITAEAVHESFEFVAFLGCSLPMRTPYMYSVPELRIGRA